MVGIWVGGKDERGACGEDERHRESEQLLVEKSKFRLRLTKLEEPEQPPSGNIQQASDCALSPRDSFDLELSKWSGCGAPQHVNGNRSWNRSLE